MDLTPYVAALRDDLAAAASAGDETTARAATSLSAALEPATRLALMNALSDLAAEVTTALDDRTVDLRLRGKEVDVVVSGSSPRDGSGGSGPDPNGFRDGPTSGPFGGPGGAGGPGGGGGPYDGSDPRGGPDVGDISRMTLRLVDQIKGQAERAAAAQGMSLNSWVAQAVQGALRGQGGWGQGNWGQGNWGQGGSGQGGWGGDGSGWSGHGWGRGWPGHDWSGGGWSGTDRSEPSDAPSDASGTATGGSGASESSDADGSPASDREGRDRESRSREGRDRDGRGRAGRGKAGDDGEGGVQGWVRG